MERRGTEWPEVLTVEEVAEYLRVSTKTVYGLAASGELACFRVGRALRCRMRDVEGFIARTRAAVGSEERSELGSEGANGD